MRFREAQDFVNYDFVRVNMINSPSFAEFPCNFAQSDGANKNMLFTNNNSILEFDLKLR